MTINVHVAPSPVPTGILRSEDQVPITSSESASSNQGSFPTDSPQPKVIALNVFQEEVTEDLLKAAEFEEGSSLPVLAGSVAPKVSSLQSDDEGEGVDTVWLHCDICDSGIGIPGMLLFKSFKKHSQMLIGFLIVIRFSNVLNPYCSGASSELALFKVYGFYYHEFYERVHP